ncbi:LOW QUALITY PROTEIN: hypothetical protein HID58_012734, partial [Brassica napus]
MIINPLRPHEAVNKYLSVFHSNTAEFCLLRFWEAININKGKELMSVDISCLLLQSIPLRTMSFVHQLLNWEKIIN